jgi:hypothetical protein
MVAFSRSVRESAILIPDGRHRKQGVVKPVAEGETGGEKFFALLAPAR